MEQQKENKHTGQQEKDLVVFAHLRWDFVFQRPQHLLTRLARRRRVFYVEEVRFDAAEASLEVRAGPGGVHIVTPWLVDKRSKEEDRYTHIDLVNRLLEEHRIENFIAWYYTPLALGFSEHLAPDLVVYDCMDELSAFNGQPAAKLKAYEQELLNRADVVFTGGRSLYEAKKDLHPNVHLFPSSIDRDHFAQARDMPADREPVDQYFIPHPRLGYYGVIDERIDYSLLAGLAAARPEWQIIMVGPPAKVELADLPKADNIHYLGPKNYEDLPRYLATWDVALMPFALNQSTRYISPTKTPEYLAGGKPVVSTPVSDVVRDYGEPGLVAIASDVEEFAAAVESALGGGGRSAWLERVDRRLAEMSWDHTIERMEELMRQAEERRAAQPEAPVDGRLDGHKSKNGKKALRMAAAAVAASAPEVESATLLTSSNGASAGNGRSGRPSRPYDYLIVGAGFAGSVLAERLANGSGARVLVVDRRPHIGGNAYDRFNDDGLLIHQYGPHIFHTNSKEVFLYLSRFTEWRPYQHRVRASVDGQLVPMPINLDTINQLYGLNLSSSEVEAFLQSLAEPRDPIVTSEDVVVSKVGKELYQKFFRNYTRKQWDLDPSELDASVTSRVPIRYNRDDRYFTDTYQAMPRYGYTRMFERMLDHPNIQVMLNTDYRDVCDMIPYREMIYTGPVDEYFDYAHGKLPYRSLEFKFETLDKPWEQPVAVINYPNDNLYTRVTEFKHLTGQEHARTTLVYEYPTAEGDPYYPIPRPENAALYSRYQKLAESTSGVWFAGRLATYRYYNMDQVTAQALAVYQKMTGESRDGALKRHQPQLVPAVRPKVKAGEAGASTAS